MANESLLITMLPDGTFHVKETEDADPADAAGTPPIDQSVKSPDEVTQLVAQWLQEEASEDDSEDAADGGADESSEPADAGDANGAPPTPAATKAAWNAEAKGRNAAGFRQ
jgi:hypothetical protein